jgi:hypothetical protein
MLSMKVRLGAALGFAIALAAGFSLSASPAMATTALPAHISPASAEDCMDGTGVSAGECTYIDGVGNTVYYMQGLFINEGYITIYNIHIELTGPSGLIKNCTQVNVVAGTEAPVCQWSPEGPEPFGTYCSYAWEGLGSNNYKEVAKSCVGVSE